VSAFWKPSQLGIYLRRPPSIHRAFPRRSNPDLASLDRWLKKRAAFNAGKIGAEFMHLARGRHAASGIAEELETPAAKPKPGQKLSNG